jgi:hypothetical protein
MLYMSTVNGAIQKNVIVSIGNQAEKSKCKKTTN